MISIIVPVYNVENYLLRCLDSIAQQTYTDFEAILIDDGSTDLSGHICDDYSKKDNRFRVIHQKNQGLSGARNTGLSETKGDYFCFIDSDDYIHPLYLETLYNTIVKIGCDVSMVNNKMTSVFGEYSDIVIKEPIIYSQKEIMHFIFKHIHKFVIVTNKLFKASLKEMRFNMVDAEDLDFNVRITQRINSLAYIDSELYYYFIREGSITHNSSYEAYKDINVIHFYIQNLKNIPTTEPLYQKYCVRRIVKKYLNTIYQTRGKGMVPHGEEELTGLKRKILILLTNSSFVPFYEKAYMKLFVLFPATYSLFRWILETVVNLRNLLVSFFKGMS